MTSRNEAACRMACMNAIEALGIAMEDPVRAQDLILEAIRHAKGARRHAMWWAQEHRPKAEPKAVKRTA